MGRVARAAGGPLSVTPRSLAVDPRVVPTPPPSARAEVRVHGGVEVQERPDVVQAIGVEVIAHVVAVRLVTLQQAGQGPPVQVTPTSCAGARPRRTPPTAGPARPLSLPARAPAQGAHVRRRAARVAAPCLPVLPQRTAGGLSPLAAGAVRRFPATVAKRPVLSLRAVAVAGAGVLLAGGGCLVGCPTDLPRAEGPPKGARR